MMEHWITALIVLVSVLVGFFMGRRTVLPPEQPVITTPFYDDSGKDVLNTPDIFSESVNELEDKDERVSTL